MKVHVEEEYIRFTISGSDILVSDFIAIYNWTCRYTRDNLHLDLHHLAMIYLIQRSIYTLKEIKLENKELIYHTVLCSGVEPFSISESVWLLRISPLTFTFLSINTSQYQQWALIGLHNTSNCLKLILQWLTKKWFIWPMNYVS